MLGCFLKIIYFDRITIKFIIDVGFNFELGVLEIDNCTFVAISSSFMGAFVCIMVAVKVRKDKKD